MRATVDLNDHMNLDNIKGSPAVFPIIATPVMFRNPLTNEIEPMSERAVIVREDTGRALSVVSDRYALIQHIDVLNVVQSAIEGLDVGPVPRGLVMQAHGARMNALFKFPSLERSLLVNAQDRRRDQLCPVIKVTNTLDATSKVSIEIGAFSFVCTNFSVGGSGFFAGGYMSVHSGVINLDDVAKQLQGFLKRFDALMDLLGYWSTIHALKGEHVRALKTLPATYGERLIESRTGDPTVYDVYNQATKFCTHDLKSAQRAVHLLSEVNRGFQRVDEWAPLTHRIEETVEEAELVNA